MKKFNLAALPLAVAGVFASTSAFAGTEACFEVYRVAAGAVVTDHDVLYTPASCAYTGGVDASDQLFPVVNAKVAWELTGDLDIDMEALGAVNPRHHIIYIPTTDIPPASRIEMEISGADFGTGNSNQIYLVHVDGAGEYQTVASSDGAFDNTSKVEFLTKAGVTIGAGSRLLLSQTNPSDIAEAGGLIEGISLHIANDETCTIDPKVTIAAVSAKTDSGSTILGGTTTPGSEVTILDISEQFEIVANPQATNEILVDAEQPSERKEFVVSKTTGGDWVGQVISKDTGINPSAFWETQFINNYDDLDDAVDIDADDEIIVNAVASSSTGDGVSLSFLANIGAGASANLGDGTALDAAEADHLAAGATDNVVLLDINEAGAVNDLITLTETPTNYTIDADELFRSNESTDVYTVARLMNSGEEIMEFNYDVSTTWSMDFNDANLLNKNGCETPMPFNVGVNGAVLKVPYTYKTDKNWVRITSEHSDEAQIFMDIFDESSNEYKNLDLGTIQGKSSVVLLASDMIAAAEAAGYAGTGNRHTMTFTVTAPKNKVHGVSVQAIPGGVDRVLPVLDQNDWRQ